MAVHTVRFHLWWVFPFRQLNAKLFPDRFLGCGDLLYCDAPCWCKGSVTFFVPLVRVCNPCADDADDASFGIDNNKYRCRCDMPIIHSLISSVECSGLAQSTQTDRSNSCTLLEWLYAWLRLSVPYCHTWQACALRLWERFCFLAPLCGNKREAELHFALAIAARLRELGNWDES